MFVTFEELSAMKHPQDDPGVFHKIDHHWTGWHNGETTAPAGKYHDLAAGLPVNILVWSHSKEGHALVQFHERQAPVLVLRECVRWVERVKGGPRAKPAHVRTDAKITGQPERAVCNHCGLEMARNNTCQCQE